MSKPKLLILGYGRHGKDTAAELLSMKYGLSFVSSSMFCAERVVLPAFRKGVSAVYGNAMHANYPDAAACFEDRHNHRALWYDLISDYNYDNPARLGQEIFQEFDIYCGLRSSREFHALKNTSSYDVAIWVDASQREPAEDKSSCTVEPWMADFVIDNNGTTRQLAQALDALMENLGVRAS